MRIHSLSARIEEIPLRAPFVTARDALARQSARTVVISLVLDDGTQHPGDAVPVAYVTGETPESALRDVQAAAPVLSGLDVRRIRPALDRLDALLPASPTARAGIESAIWRAHAAVLGADLWTLWGGARESVETDITLSIVDDAPERAREGAARGFQAFKVKVGGDPEADLARLCAIHAAVPGGRFRVDANQAFTPQEAVRFVNEALASGVPLELLEQPVSKSDMAGLDYAAQRCPVPVFADEAVLSPSDALRLVRETAVQGINVKVMKSGARGALEIAAIARAAGRLLMLGCMLESRRSIGLSVALACGTGAFDFIDLDSHLLLTEPGPNEWLISHGPVLAPLR